MAKTITETQAAKDIGISRTHLVNLRNSNRGPSYIRAGGRILYRPEAIDAWLDSNTHQSGGPEQAEVEAVTEEAVATVPEEEETVEEDTLVVAEENPF